MKPIPCLASAFVAFVAFVALGRLRLRRPRRRTLVKPRRPLGGRGPPFVAEGEVSRPSDAGAEAGGGAVDGGGRCVATCRLAVDAACQARCVSTCGTTGCDVPAFPFEQVTAVRCSTTPAVEYYVLSQGKSCQVP